MGLDVKVRDGESQDALLRRFQRSVQMEGVLREAKAHQHFVSRGDAARIKQRANARRKRRAKQM